jgi:hypothetical protein
MEFITDSLKNIFRKKVKLYKLIVSIKQLNRLVNTY